MYLCSRELGSAQQGSPNIAPNLKESAPTRAWRSAARVSFLLLNTRKSSKSTLTPDLTLNARMNDPESR